MEGRIPGWRGGQWQGEQERKRMGEGVARAHFCDRVRLFWRHSGNAVKGDL